MTFRKHHRQRNSIWTGILAVIIGGLSPVLQAVEIKTLTMTVDVTVIQPPCEVVFLSGDNVALGNLQGTKMHTPIQIRMTCNDVTMEPELWATAGALVEGTTNEAQMKSTGSATGKSVRLFLNNTAGNKVPLNGKESDGFCKGGMNNSNFRDCTLTPVTVVEKGSVTGNVSGTILFGVRYS